SAWNPRAMYSGLRSAAVVHLGVLHAQDRRILRLLEPGVDHLADEEGVVAGVHLLAHLALDEGDGLVEDGRARAAVAAGEAGGHGPDHAATQLVELLRVHGRQSGGTRRTRTAMSSRSAPSPKSRTARSTAAAMASAEAPARPASAFSNRVGAKAPLGDRASV